VGPYVPLDDGCSQCRKESFAFDQAFRLGVYDGILRDIVLRLKHWSGEGLGEAVGRLWAEHSASRLRTAGVDVVIPIPLHWRKRWQRGYNQTHVLARCLADALKVPCRPAWLRRVRFTAQQKQLSPTARRDNVHNAFRAAKGIDVAGKTVLLVDDVMTSGATAHEAARALRPARPGKIVLAVLAHERKKNERSADVFSSL
jgi:ComF family protein